MPNETKPPPMFTYTLGKREHTLSADEYRAVRITGECSWEDYARTPDKPNRADLAAFAEAIRDRPGVDSRPTNDRTFPSYYGAAVALAVWMFKRAPGSHDKRSGQRLKHVRAMLTKLRTERDKSMEKVAEVHVDMWERKVAFNKAHAKVTGGRRAGHSMVGEVIPTSLLREVVAEMEAMDRAKELSTKSC